MIPLESSPCFIYTKGELLIDGTEVTQDFIS